MKKDALFATFPRSRGLLLLIAGLAAALAGAGAGSLSARFAQPGRISQGDNRPGDGALGARLRVERERVPSADAASPTRQTALPSPAEAPRAFSKVVDLGHPLSDADPSWSGQKVFTWSLAATMDKDGYFAGRFSTDEHFGTHLDAPAHFAPKGWTVDQIPPDRLVRPGVCLTIEDKVRLNEDYALSLADVRAFEQRTGPIPDGAIVLVATGWDRRWIEPSRYMNERGGVKHFPGVAPDAAAYLARTRTIAGLGIDTPSVDVGPSEKFETHRTTQPLNIYHIENAARLTALPPRGFTVVVAPVKIRGGSGGPTRVFALFD